MIYVTGDMHGEQSRFDDSRIKKLKRGDYLIICGDFGFLWDNSAKERAFLKKLSKKKYTTLFIDGTHENFDLLNQYEVSKWNGGKVHLINDKVIHLMRGQIYEIEDQTVFTMGGGVSSDIDIRFENETWSSAEIPSKEELVEGVDNLEKYGGKIDLVITHEPPAKMKEFMLLKEKKMSNITGINTYLQEMSEVCSFSHWFFGSLHIDKYISQTHVSVFKNVFDAKTGERV